MELGQLLPERSAGDVLAGRTWLALGDRVYEMPALTIDESERWLGSMESELSGLLNGLEASGDDLPRILALLTGAPARLLDLLYSYDIRHVLPPREELSAQATKSQLLTAVLGVWQTENPLVALALAGITSGLMSGPTVSASSAPTSSSRPPTAGRRKRSDPN